MKAVEELEHWMGRLALELARRAPERGHVAALARLCELLADRVRRDKWAPPSELPQRMRLSTDWIELARRAKALTERPAPVRTVGGLRVFEGGRGKR